MAEGTILTYERHWRALVAFCLKHHVEPASLEEAQAQILYEQQTGGRSASHHLGAKAAFAFAFRFLESPNPFTKCVAPAPPDRVDTSFLDAAGLGALFATLQAAQQSYFDRLTYVLASALYHTAARFNDWAPLSTDALQLGPQGWPVAVHFGSRARHVALPEPTGRELQRWLRQLDLYRGARLRGHDLTFAASRLIFPGRGGGPISNQFFNARLRAACQLAGVMEISANGLRHSAAKLFLSDPENSLRDVQELLGHRKRATTARYAAGLPPGDAKGNGGGEVG